MSDIIRFPGWRFGPDGEEELFENEEQVPEGWLDNPNDFAQRGAKTLAREAAKEEKDVEKQLDKLPKISAYDGWSKDQMTAELKVRGVTFNPNWPEKKLLELLEKKD